MIKCDICGKVNNHMNLHQTAVFRMMIYVCDDCEESFMKVNLLRIENEIKEEILNRVRSEVKSIYNSHDKN
ncbi:MAG: hypothetical protein DRJ64_06540 [Thermoprotei archaeon]|nr:MAG: hypothetical protein DRJ64_06540 [Thermoprotei archaeon]